MANEPDFYAMRTPTFMAYGLFFGGVRVVFNRLRVSHVPQNFRAVCVRERETGVELKLLVEA